MIMTMLLVLMMSYSIVVTNPSYSPKGEYEATNWH
jgi:hypothetical protein